MKKVLQIAILLFIITGCHSLKQGWNNFTAYYNTFYNARQFYNSGLEKNRDQLSEINPNQPIRVHRSPTNAGLEDFENAIEKGSNILRKHDESKYVVPALFIIGKSYYYRSEYFAALEKFQELDALTDGEERQEAIIWLGLTYLEMSNFDRGVQILEYELNGDLDWTPRWRAEVHIVLGELYAEMENWELASEYLEDSLAGIEDDHKKAKTHFLLGQVLEKMGELNRALFFYTRINDLKTDFDLEFNAIRKQAEVSRQIGNYDYAVDIYQRMRRDDKYLEYRSDLQYEIARSLQLKGDKNRAIENYNNVLNDRMQPPTNLTIAKTYYGLGEIYRDELEDLGMAAAYFDSAASQRVDQSRISADFNASELAASFGEYVSVKQSIASKDSLLHLAEMDPDELESFLDRLRQQEMQRLQNELEQMQDQRDQMLVADQSREPIQAASITEYGFLNIESPTRLADASLQFQAIWGDRPLADNWRRREAVSGSRFDQIAEEATETDQVSIPSMQSTGITPSVDTSNIPFTEEAKDKIKSEIEALNYRLGNVFFLTLNMPDSARVYYQKVINSNYDYDLVTKSLYSIAEVDLLQNNRNRAVQWYQKLKEREGAYAYSQRLAERLNINTLHQEEEQSDSIEMTPDPLTVSDTLSVQDDLVMLSDSVSNRSYRAFILFDKAKDYVQKAKNQPGYEEKIREWSDKHEEFENQKEQLMALKDSAEVTLADTSLTDNERQYWQQISDTTLTEPDFSEFFPFEGVYWDSTRAMLSRIQNQYSASIVMPQVNILLETLAKPSRDSVALDDSLSIDADIDQSKAAQDKGSINYPTCDEAGVQLNIDGGMDTFMNSLSYPEWTNDVSIRGELEYLFIISNDGSIESYEQLSRMDRSGIPQAVEAGIEHSLQFTAPEDGQKVQCTLVFPFNL